jgi:hypothetical protein
MAGGDRPVTRTDRDHPDLVRPAFALISARHCSGLTPSGELTCPRRSSSA